MPKLKGEKKEWQYFGNALGMNYAIEFDTDEEFKIWLKERLEHFLFGEENPASDVVLDILGINTLKARLSVLENK